MNNRFIQGVEFDWNNIANDSYVRAIKAFDSIVSLKFNSPITFFVGENGSGKSTLLEAIAVSCGFNPEGGTKNYNFSTRDTHSDLLHPSAKYHEKSHGESFIALIQNNFRSNGLYLLDEPEAALSPQMQLSLLMEIYRCAISGSQFVIVTHSPILMGIPNSDIYSFGDDGINLCEYEQTDSYRIMKMFVNNKDAMLDMLLEE